MIKLYGFGRVSGRSVGLTRDLRVLWALEEFRQEYAVIETNLGSPLSSEVSAAVGPFGLPPAIEDGGFVLRESGAILLYLADKAGALEDDPRSRAELAQWCFAVLTTLEPWLTALWRDVSATGEAHDRRLRTAEKRLRHFETALQSKTHLLGEVFTVADILLTTVLKLAHRMELLATLPMLEAYRRRCEVRPCRIKTLDEYEDRLGLARGAAR